MRFEAGILYRDFQWLLLSAPNLCAKDKEALTQYIYICMYVYIYVYIYIYIYTL